MGAGQLLPTGEADGQCFHRSLHGKLRQECLSAHWFLTLADAREKMEAWHRFYNEDRPHSAIGYNVPIALTNYGGEAGPPL
jgi:putative transposase